MATDDAAHRVINADAELLRVAQGASRSAFFPESGGRPSHLSEFLQIYREWIARDRGALGTHEEQIEQWQMLVHCMVAGTTVEQAARLLVRFAPVVWGARAPTIQQDDGDAGTVIFRDPFRPGAPGLIASLWMLSLILCTLEFMAGGRFSGASGRVMHQPCLPDGVANLLFGAPVAFGAGEVALVVPRTHWQRPVVVRGDDLPEFFRELLPLTLGAKRGRPQLRAMVAGLLRSDKAGTTSRASTQVSVAARLGVSQSGLKRRLGEEGTTFRAIREGVYDELAGTWLADGEMAIEDIAARLGFSDAYAFRRFFKRRNAISPSAWRRIHRQAARPT